MKKNPSGKDQTNQAGKDEIHHSEKDGHDGNKAEHHHAGGTGFFPVGPADLAQLNAGQEKVFPERGKARHQATVFASGLARLAGGGGGSRFGLRIGFRGVTLFFAHVSLKTEKTKEMAGQEGFEPPTCGFGDRRSAVGATGLRYEALLRFAMSRMFLVPGAILLDFKTTGSVLLVLNRGVVAALALSAGEQDIHAHGITPRFQSPRRNRRCGRLRG